MAVEISSKLRTKEKTSRLNFVLYVCLAVFVVFALSYFALFFYEKRALEELSELERQLVRTPDEVVLEQEALLLRKQIEDFGYLLSRHFFPSRIFSLLESSVHPRVWFSEMRTQTEQGMIDLEGRTDNFQALGQQLLIFEQQEAVKSAQLSEINIDKTGEIVFDVRLVIDADSLR